MNEFTAPEHSLLNSTVCYLAPTVSRHCWRRLEQVLFSLCSIFKDFLYSTLRIWFQSGPFICLHYHQRETGLSEKWNRNGDSSSVSGTVKSPFFLPFCLSAKNVPILMLPPYSSVSFVPWSALWVRVLSLYMWQELVPRTEVGFNANTKSSGWLVVVTWISDWGFWGYIWAQLKECFDWLMVSVTDREVENSGMYT